MRRPRVSGLYFPYATIDSVRTLKTAILYFDTIAVIDPRASFCGRYPDPEAVHHESRRYLDETAILIDEGILTLVDPVEVIQEWGKEIMEGVIQDVDEPDFLKACEPCAGSRWVLASTKLPDHADKWLRNMLVNVPTLSVHGGGMLRGEYSERQLDRLVERNPYLYERMHHLRHFEERRSRYDGEYQSQLLREMMYDEQRIVELPFHIGESVMLGHTLAAAASRGLSPFCDDHVHMNVLSAKINRFASNRAVKAVLHEFGYLKNVKADLLAQNVLAETVPSLETVPIEAIMKFREKRREDLENFRAEVQSLVTEIEEAPWEPTFGNRVREVVDTRVIPALRQVNNDILECKETFWADALKALANVSPLPIVCSLFSGVPAHVAVGLGASLAGLTLLLERWGKMKKVKRNGWAFLIDSGSLRWPTRS